MSNSISGKPILLREGRKGRVVGLDYMRISLAMLVFLFHSHCYVLKCDYGILNGFVNMGAIAMTGFFLLSGYALNLSNGSFENASDIKKFYIKRLISILPLYYAYAAINVAINIFQNGTSAVIEELILFPTEFIGIQSVFASLFPYSHNGGSWFISCILICYFLYPLLQLISKRLSDKARMTIILILSGILLYSPFVEHYFGLQSIYSNPFFRAIEFSIGVLVSQLNMDDITESKLISLLRKPAACIITVFCLVAGTTVAVHIGIPGDFMLYNWIALPCFISLLVSLGHIKFKENRAVRYFSNLSFSLFLSQLLVVWSSVKYLLDHVGCDVNIVKILISAAVCFGIANFLHYCIEKPSAKYLKSKLL